MAGGVVNRTLLSTFYQNAGDVYDDNKTEGAYGVLADQTDANWTDYAVHKAAAVLDHPNLSVTTAKIALLAITAAQIALATITAAQLANLAVTNPKLATGIDAVKLADGSVTNTVLQFINTLSSNAQTQIDSKIPLSQKGAASGVVPLNASSKIDTTYIPDSVLGQLEYQGTWNATTNTPAMVTPSTVKGDYYIVSVAGTYLTVVYDVGDWIVSNGTIWQKVDNTDAVATVFGRTGAIVAATNDYTWAQINKTVSSLLDLTTRSASDLNSGTLPVARIPTGIPTLSVGTGVVDDAHLAYLADVTSLIQAQLNAKAPSTSPTFLTSAVLPSNTTIGSVSPTEIGYLDNVSSPIQTQIDAKAPLTHVGAGGSAQHPDATTSQSGFLSAAKKIQYDSLIPAGLASYSVPVGQIFSLWGRYSFEQDATTGEMVIYEI